MPILTPTPTLNTTRCTATVMSCRCGTLLSVAYVRLGQPDEAIAQLEVISADCVERDDPAGVGQITEEIGDILNQQDRTRRGLRYLTAAEAFRAAEQPLDDFRNRRQHATSLMWANDLHAAMAALAVADEQSLSLPTGVEPHDTERVGWERAILLYEGARILRAAGRGDEAIVRAARATGASAAGDFLAQSAQAELLQGELLLEAGRPAEAEAAGRRALERPAG